MSAQPSALDFNAASKRAAATETAVPALPANGEVRIAGRLMASRPRDGGGYYHLLVLPAPDEFSHPATVELSSNGRIGQPNEIVNVTCRISGIPNNFDYTDKSTGQRINVRSARNYLTVIE